MATLFLPAAAIADVEIPAASPQPATSLTLPPDTLDFRNLPPEEEPIEHFQQDFEHVTFVPKGQWVAGVSINYTQSNQNNYQFIILENLNGDSYTFKIAPKVLYVFKDDMGAGAQMSYTRALTKLESGKIVLDSETDYDFNNLYVLSHNYSVMGIFRNYFSLGSSKRFGFFNEIQLQLGGGQSKFCKGRGNDIIGSFSRNFNLNVGLAPGLIVFLNNYSALEVNIGVLGFQYNYSKIISNQVRTSHIKTKSANFRINLFSITFGMAFYL